MNDELAPTYFRRSFVWLAGSRVAGMLLAQAVAVPAAMWITTVADLT